MKNVYIYCEGQSEESFIREVIAPYFGKWSEINSGRHNPINLHG